MAILDNKPIHDGFMAHSGITTAPTRTCPQTASQGPLRTSADTALLIGYTRSDITAAIPTLIWRYISSKRMRKCIRKECHDLKIIDGKITDMRLGIEKYACYSTKTNIVDDIINMANSDKNSIFCETKKILKKN